MSLYDIDGNLISGNGTSSNFFDVTYPQYSNLFNGEYEIGGISSTGSVNTAQTSCIVSDYMDITGGAYLYPEVVTKFTMNPEKVASELSVSCVFVGFYDTDKNFISLVTRPTAPVKIPSNAVYARVSWQPYTMNDINTDLYFVGVASDNNKATIPWEQYYEKGQAKSAYIKPENFSYTDESPYKGKRWVLFADSLTDSYGGHDWQESTSPVGGVGWKESTENVPWTGYFWATKIARETGLILDNRAKSGSNINVGDNGNYANVCGVNMLDTFISEIEAGAEQPYLITVGFGSNAITSQCGTSADTSETTSTVCGATKYFIEKLREHCPNSIILFVLPPQSDWGDSSTVKSVADGRNAIKSVLDLDEYSVPYVDMWKESGITVDMLPDGIHISSIEAQNKYYYIMRKAII